MLRLFILTITVFSFSSSIFAKEKVTHLLCKASDGSSESFTIEEEEKIIQSGEMKGRKTLSHLIGIGNDAFMNRSNYKISCGVDFNPSNLADINPNVIRCHWSIRLDLPPQPFGLTPIGQKGKRNRVITINKTTGSFSDLVYDEVDYHSALYYYPDILHKFSPRVLGDLGPNEIRTKALSQLQGVCEKRTGNLF
jgi:hypothetical protein